MGRVIKDQIRAGWVLPLLVHATGGICGASAAEPAFTDVTKEVGGLSGYTTVHPYTAPHAAWGDFDNDGWVDIFQGSLGYEDRPPMVCGVWRNVGGKKFELAAELPPDCLAAIWGDYDNDGFLDLYCWSRRKLNADGGSPPRISMKTEIWTSMFPTTVYSPTCFG